MQLEIGRASFRVVVCCVLARKNYPALNDNQGRRVRVFASILLGCGAPERSVDPPKNNGNDDFDVMVTSPNSWKQGSSAVFGVVVGVFLLCFILGEKTTRS